MELTKKQKDLIQEWFHLAIEEKIEDMDAILDKIADDFDSVGDLMDTIPEIFADGAHIFICVNPNRRERIEEIFKELGV